MDTLNQISHAWGEAVPSLFPPCACVVGSSNCVWCQYCIIHNPQSFKIANNRRQILSILKDNENSRNIRAATDKIKASNPHVLMSQRPGARRLKMFLLTEVKKPLCQKRAHPRA